MRYHFRIKEEDEGYFAQCIELEGRITQGDSITIEFTQSNIKTSCQKNGIQKSLQLSKIRKETQCYIGYDCANKITISRIFG